jgi:peptide/nickel transport system substrate-binding protein
VLALAGSVVVCAGVLAGCASTTEVGGEPVAAPPTTVPQRGGHLVYGLESDPNGLDPTRNAWDNSGIQLANALYDPLVAVNAEGEFEPYLAESLTPNVTYTQWSVKLREGVRFSNGDPLDSATLAEFIEKLRTSFITGPPAKFITGVAAVDPLTVLVTTSLPWATLPALLSGQGGYVVSPKQIASDHGTSQPIGTGPFMLRRWTQDKKFELVRNPGYWRAGLPYLDALDFVIEPMGNRRIELMMSGAMDITSLSSPWDLRSLNATMATSAGAARLSVERDVSDSEKTFIMFNTTRWPFDDVRIRQAMAYATDMREVAEVSGWSESDRAKGPFNPDSPYYLGVDYPAYDPNKARSLLREYQADTGVRGRNKEIAFTLTAPNVGSEYIDVLLKQWRKVGINARFELLDVKAIVRRAVSGLYDAMVLRYYAAPDPDVLWHFFANDTIDPAISLNFPRLHSEKISSGMTEGRATPEPAERKQAYAKVQEALAVEMPYVWMNHSEWQLVSLRDVRDAHNVTLPDHSPAQPMMAGTHRLTEAWLDR